MECTVLQLQTEGEAGREFRVRERGSKGGKKRKGNQKSKRTERGRETDRGA